LYQENRWVAASLLRAKAREDGDGETMARAASAFEALGARFEAAVTRARLGGPVGEQARAELREMGCTPPA
jgi:hypothetical protein